MESNLNIFEAFQSKKNKVLLLAKDALDNGYINKEEYDSILNKIEADTLTIGVIGQMKCGKSTFLNSFLFGNQLLPAATTPMTAALSVITYGSEKHLEVEFYSTNEWENLKILAQQDENNVSDSQVKQSIKAAKELVGDSLKLGSQLNSLLGTKAKDKFENLIEYVGRDGKFVSIVKSVQIFLPIDWLKGVKIVDTPGINDPVVSREERTKLFLKDADVVLMIVSALRPFDSTDTALLDNIRRVGVGKIILGISKYDIQLLDGESPEQIKANVRDGINKYVRSIKDDDLIECISEIEPVPFSSLMSLLARMNIEDIKKDSDLLYHYDDYLKKFEFTGQQQLLEGSNISELEEKVRDVIQNKKESILIQKPTNRIIQAIQNLADELKIRLTTLGEEKKVLEMPDDEIDEYISALEKVQRRLSRKISNAKDEFSDAYEQIARNIERTLQDSFDKVISDLNRIIDDNRRDEMFRKIENRINKYNDRELPRSLEDASEEIENALKDKINQLSDNARDIIESQLEDSYELAEDFNNVLRKATKNDLTYSSNHGLAENDVTYSSNHGLAKNDVINFIRGLFDGITTIISPLGWLKKLKSQRDEARDKVFEWAHSFDFSTIKEQIQKGKQEFLSALNSEEANEMIANLIVKAEEAKKTKEDKQEKLQQVVLNMESIQVNIQKCTDDKNRLFQIIES